MGKRHASSYGKHPYAGDDDLCELADMYIEDLDDDSGEYYEDMDGDHDSAMASIGWERMRITATMRRGGLVNGASFFYFYASGY